MQMKEEEKRSNKRRLRDSMYKEKIYDEKMTLRSHRRFQNNLIYVKHEGWKLTKLQEDKLTNLIPIFFEV